MKWKIFLAVAYVAVMFTVEQAQADVITFNGISSIYTGHTEGDFSTSVFSGTFLGNLGGFGNPVPSIYNSSSQATLSVTENTTGFFTLSIVDIGAAFTNSYDTDYTLAGFLNGSSVFNTSGMVVGYGVFDTISSPNSSLILDELRITIGNAPSVANIDNIVVFTSDEPSTMEPTPEPTSLAIFGIGALCMGAGAARRRRKEKQAAA